MANFNEAINLTLPLEGGYQNNSADPGNYNSLGLLVGTNFGINAITFQNYFGFPPTSSDMINLTVEDAKAIFKVNYWDKYNIGAINSQGIANHIFDLTVLHGNFMWIINRAMIAYGINRTNYSAWNLTAINDINAMKDPVLFNTLLFQNRLAYFDYIIGVNPSLSVFRNGWINRANAYKDLEGKKGNKFMLYGGLALAALVMFPIAIRVKKEKKRKR